MATSATTESPARERVLSVGGYKFVDPEESFGSLLKACLAELLGMGLFVFISTGVVTSGCHTKDVAESSGNGGDTFLTNAVPGSCFLSSTTALQNIAFAFGFTLFVVIYFTASFSGGHINPAVTLAIFLTRQISLVRGILYVAFQCGGSAIGSIILKGMDPNGYAAAGGAANQLSKEFGVSAGAALGYEIILTFALVFTVFAATDTQRAVSTAHLGVLAPLAIGMIVFVAHLVLIPLDGCSINPGRSFGPAVVSRTFNHHWIFWYGLVHAGPFIGAMAAAALYTLAFKSWQPERIIPRTPRGSPMVGSVKRPDVETGLAIPPPLNTDTKMSSLEQNTLSHVAKPTQSHVATTVV